jgi:hypothetical protein
MQCTSVTRLRVPLFIDFQEMASNYALRSKRSHTSAPYASENEEMYGKSG